MKKYVALPTKEKGKPAMSKWENDDSDILWALYCVCKNNSSIFSMLLLVNLFKQRYSHFVKSCKYLNKFISYV